MNLDQRRLGDLDHQPPEEVAAKPQPHLLNLQSPEEVALGHRHLVMQAQLERLLQGLEYLLALA
jgi:hypothetical protein